MDKDHVIDVAPHYVALAVLALLLLSVARTIVGGMNFWIGLVIITAVVLSYRPIVMRLGIGPDSWEQRYR